MANKQKLKIGFVLDDSLDKTDGVQQYVLALGEWFVSEGHEVRYLVGETTRHDIVGVYSLSRNLRVRFNHNQMSMPMPAPRAGIKQVIESEAFDVLHVQIPYSPWLAHRVVTAASTNTVVIGTFHIVAHSSLVKQATRALAIWTRSSLRRFDRIVSVSSAAADYANATYGINTLVVPNVIAYERFADAKPLAAYDAKTITILFLGRLVERKGCLQLLKALVILQNSKNTPSFPAYRVLICGTGPLEQQLKNYAHEHRLSEIVKFVGYVSEEQKPSYYAAADIAVFPSTGGESFGIVLIEAMASGRATVLAGDNSGYRTVMQPQPELLFDPYNTVDLAEKISYFLRNIPARLRMAAWGSAYARQFDTNRVGAQLLELYEEALRKRRQP
jgi:phosphatidylinositol alpha-mannosyltransferase